MNDEIPHPSLLQLPRVREMIEKGLENGMSHPDAGRNIVDIAIDNYWLEDEIMEFLSQYKMYKKLTDEQILTTIKTFLENRTGEAADGWRAFVEKMLAGQIVLP